MEFFSSDFYLKSLQVNKRVAAIDMKKILFPEIHYVIPGDENFFNLWSKIDSANDYVWLLTYTFNSTYSAQVTMLKLIDAQKRGVSCMLMVDDLNQWVDKSLREEFEKCGGMFYSLNPVSRFWNIINKTFFRRHHEKVTMVDDWVCVGSSNISDDYTGLKYGRYFFLDLNVYMRNMCLSAIRSIFKVYADRYNIRLHRNLSNEETLQLYEAKYPDSDFYKKRSFEIMRTHQPDKHDIQKCIMKMIENAEKKITIIQPYYYPIKRVEKAIIDALDRGVEVELISSAKRDQMCYANLSTFMMTKKLIQKGLKVYDITDKYLHMKGYLVDGKQFTLGSFNNDLISWYVNDEINVVVDDPYEVQRVEKIIDDLKGIARRIDPKTRIGLIRQAKIKFWEFFIFGSERTMNITKYERSKRFLSNIRQQFRDNKDFLNSSLEKQFQGLIHLDWDQNLIHEDYV